MAEGDIERGAATATWKPVVRDAVAGALAGLGATRPARRAADRLSILTFHRVLLPEERAGYPLPGLAISPGFLRAVLAFCREHFCCLALSDAAARFAAGERAERPFLALTFDDGQRDNFLRARPVLAELGLRATFYVPVASVESGAPLWHDAIAFAASALHARDPQGAGARLRALPGLGALSDHDARDPLAVVEAAKTLAPAGRAALLAAIEAEGLTAAPPPWDGAMGWEELRTLADEGHEIGSHSTSHELLVGCDATTLEREIAGSKQRLEAAVGRAVTSFCYPAGRFDRAAVEAVRASGYVTAVTTEPGANARTTDPFRLRRFNVQEDYLTSRHGRFSPALLAWRMSGLHPGAR